MYYTPLPGMNSVCDSVGGRPDTGTYQQLSEALLNSCGTQCSNVTQHLSLSIYYHPAISGQRTRNPRLSSFILKGGESPSI